MLLAVHRDPQCVLVSDGDRGKAFAVVIAGALQSQEPAIFPDFRSAIGVRVSSHKGNRDLNIRLAPDGRPAIVFATDGHLISAGRLAIDLDGKAAYFNVC